MNSWSEYSEELAKAADLTQNQGCANGEATRIAGLLLRNEDDGWWSVHHPHREEHSLLDVIHVTEYRSARRLLWDLYDLTKRQSADAGTDGHRHGREVH